MGHGGLSYRVVDGTVDLDVTDHVQGSPSLTWEAVGGCATGRVTITLPLDTFPTLGDSSRMYVTSTRGEPVWEGFFGLPDARSDGEGERFESELVGTMALAADAVEALVYSDADLGSWQRSAASVQSARVDQVEDGWQLAHPQGYVLGTGAAAGMEYRLLQHAAQNVGSVTFTATGPVTPEPGFALRVQGLAGNTVLTTIDQPLATGPTTYSYGPPELGANADVVRISLVRTGGATNVLTGNALVQITGLTVAGSRVDRYGTPVTATPVVTSAQIIDDLLGRGLLGPIDPALAIVEDSSIPIEDAAWPTGIRIDQLLQRLRDADTNMLWSYDAGGRFSWRAWPTNEPRYDLIDDLDDLAWPGSSDTPPSRITVFWRQDGGLHRLQVTIDDPSADEGARVRVADPITVPGDDATEEEAYEAGRDELERLRARARSATAEVSRLVFDRVTGLEVEPWEIRPGYLAHVDVTGEVLQITTVTASAAPDGVTATLTMGQPPMSDAERVLAIFRGDLPAPGAPIIEIPEETPEPPPTEAPETGDTSPPPYSPLPTVEASIEAALVTVPGIDPGPGYRGPIMFEIHLATSASAPAPTPGNPATLIGETQTGTFFATKRPDGLPLASGVTYYFATIAINAVGAAIPSGWVAGTARAKITGTMIGPNEIQTGNLATNYLTTAALLANDAWIGALRAVDLTAETITGPKIQTMSQANRGIKLDGWTNTLRAWDAFGNLRFEVNGNTGLGTFTSASGGASAALSAGSLVFSNSTYGTSGAVVGSSVGIRLASGSSSIDIEQSGRVQINAPALVQGNLDVLAGVLKVQGSNGFAIDTAGGYLRSPRTTNFASGGSPNVRINTDASSAVFANTESRRAIKVAIEPARNDQLQALLDLDVQTWFDRAPAEALAAYFGGGPDDPSDCAGDGSAIEVFEPLRRWPGLIAEEVYDAGATLFVDYDNREGTPRSVLYDRIGVAWIPFVRDLITRVEALEAS
ncbi:hypothetical protein [Nocardioides massiliensis]|uniref:Peptidase S74 domain-containing protein n=1 Tax=Nocardioides massiliensis TaxID=1325935 RepID=A0ABT9NJ00_9ACTN|nr:hypothetical protein [Nocardioides massiliensis]MDP9820377.1 hypothetical protein [Nocardioides massiliensis]